MGQAALKIDPDFAPANDDWRGPPTDGDPWPWRIENLKTVNTGFAVFAAKRRLSGQACIEFCKDTLAAWERHEEAEARYAAWLAEQAV